MKWDRLKEYFVNMSLIGDFSVIIQIFGIAMLTLIIL